LLRYQQFRVISLCCIWFQVALRIRPLNEDEIIQGATPIAHRVDDNVSTVINAFVKDVQLIQFAEHLCRILKQFA